MCGGREDMYGAEGHVWGACMAGRTCMAGGGHAWQGGLHGRGWVCMVGGMHGRGSVW